MICSFHLIKSSTWTPSWWWLSRPSPWDTMSDQTSWAEKYPTANLSNLKNYSHELKHKVSNTLLKWHRGRNRPALGIASRKFLEHQEEIGLGFRLIQLCSSWARLSHQSREHICKIHVVQVWKTSQTAHDCCWLPIVELIVETRVGWTRRGFAPVLRHC